jgi:hypothetical protein
MVIPAKAGIQFRPCKGPVLSIAMSRLDSRLRGMTMCLLARVSQRPARR